MTNDVDANSVPFYSKDDSLFNELLEERKRANELEQEVVRLEKQLHESRAAENRLTSQLHKLKRLAQTMLCTIRECQDDA